MLQTLKMLLKLFYIASAYFLISAKMALVLTRSLVNGGGFFHAFLIMSWNLV